MTPALISLTILGMALTGIEVSRFAPVYNAVGPSGLLLWPLGEELSALPREGTSHDRTPGRIVNETMQQMDLFDREWRLIKNDDRLVQAGSGPRAHARLVSDGRKVEGFTGCNGLHGHYELEGRNVRFVGLATTRKLCPGLMEQERAFLNGLERTRYWKAEDGRLVLMSEAREALLLFEAHTR
ncbi:MAG: META domain-containing protein [Nitrospira sp.]|nr:META domain-containing protein [Nitrospira sp.]